MRLMKSLFAVLFLVLATAAGAAELMEGKDYTVLNPPQSTESPGKVEVSEFFWYGCPHCFHFEGALNQWLKTLPKDVSFRRVPGAAKPWMPGAKLFYALEAMGLEDKLHAQIFSAIHESRDLHPIKEEGFPEWLAKKGVDTKKFSDTYSSFAIQSKVQRAMQLNAGHRIDAVPAIVINGRYRIVDPAEMTPEKFMAVANALVAKARAEQGRK
ncbi:thiol:disulfide interchange protein DsbA/DsbL [Denitratisoma oestradiolicum]|uniref:Thiol:disulfide interchange protein n=1 Tax=Denitratisoma oestradiolicum TaxID=311182 RepID=A0A6S6XT37_9PROT|nr:thiol:disulfide interchange protein DsbA/DsbL [Denitratisoma oestradiolicum]CAB1367323.1 Thiol:disulfide interchange protein DsbA [Denitratisoma oestradiolicum]